MDAKERMIEALRGGRPDRVPVAPCYLDLFLERSMGRYYEDQYRQRLGSRTRMPVGHAQDTEFRACALFQAMQVFHDSVDWLPALRMGLSLAWAHDHYVELEGEECCFVDASSGKRTALADTVIVDEATDVWDRTDVRHRCVDPEAAIKSVSLDTLVASGVLDLPKRLIRDFGDRHFTHVYVESAFAAMYGVLGFAGMMMMIHDEPKLLHRLLEHKLVQNLECLRAWAQLGVDGIWLIEAYSSADMISRRHFAEFSLPYLRAMVDAIKSLGMIAILYFCGDTVPRLDLVRPLGVHALALEEGKKTFKNEIEEIVARVGDVMCVFGNIDAVNIMGWGTPEEVEEEAKRQIRVGRSARGFIVGTGSPLPPFTAARHVDLLAQTAAKYGQW